MLPTDAEFSALYFCYACALTYFSWMAISTKRKSSFINLAIFFIYTLFVINVFFDKEIFKYGGSLPILFYSTAVLFVHILTYAIVKLITKTSKPLP